MAEISVSEKALEVAARVWCDQDMRKCVMDVVAAQEIALIVDRVLKENGAT